MTLESTVTKVSYAGDGSTASFPITFVYWDDTDIEVILRNAAGSETTWVDGTQYTISGGGGSTGTLTVDTSPTDYTPASGETLLIRSNRADTQPTDFPLGGSFPSTDAERALDQDVRLIQQLAEEMDRTVKVAKTSTTSNPELPDPVPGRALVWNSAGDGFDNATLAGSVLLDEDDMASNSDEQGVTQQSIVAYAIGTIGSIAELRLLNNSSGYATGTTVNVVGHTSDGDGGGGLFYWDSTSTATDNNGTIIKVTAVTTGRWKRNFSGAVNVKWFGATGNGTTDDYTACQATLNYVRATLGGGSVYFPAGTYLLGTGLTYDVSAVASNSIGRLKIYGDGRQSILKMTGVADSLIDYRASNSYVQGYLRIRDISLIGNSTVGSIAINISGGTAWNELKNILIEFFEYGLDMRDLDQTNFHDVIIRWCKYGGFLRGNVDVTAHNNLQFYGCTIGNNSVYGLHIEEPHGVSFYGGSFQYNGVIGGGIGQYGIELQSDITGYGVVNFIGTIFEGNGGLADIIHGMINYSNTLNVIGCGFLRSDLTTVGYATNHIYTASASGEQRINVSGCTFKATAGYTPSAARPYFNFSSGTEIFFDDGTNFYEDSVEAPNPSGWTAQYTSWTPQLWDASNSGAEGQTYAGTNAGKYFRMGNAVFITGQLAMAGLGTLTGGDGASIGNLPYQPLTPGSIDIGYTFGMSMGSASSVKGLVAAGAKKITLWLADSTGGGSALTVTEVTTAGVMVFSGWYLTDDAV